MMPQAKQYKFRDKYSNRLEIIAKKIIVNLF